MYWCGFSWLGCILKVHTNNAEFIKKGGLIMATSSITKNFVISGREQVEAFADAIEAAANDKTPVQKINARILTNPKDIAEFMKKREKANAAE